MMLKRKNSKIIYVIAVKINLSFEIFSLDPIVKVFFGSVL